MRLVALVLALGLLSSGCAMETGDPSSTDEPQRHDEIVAVSGSARPITPEPGPAPTSTAGKPTSAVTTGGSQTLPASSPTPVSGTTLESDNPNPSPWDPHSGASGQ